MATTPSGSPIGEDRLFINETAGRHLTTAIEKASQAVALEDHIRRLQAEQQACLNNLRMNVLIVNQLHISYDEAAKYVDPRVAARVQNEGEDAGSRVERVVRKSLEDVRHNAYGDDAVLQGRVVTMLGDNTAVVEVPVSRPVSVGGTVQVVIS